MTLPILAGLIMICGASLVFLGKIYYAVIVYFFGNLIWMYIAYTFNDYQGMSFMIVGGILGLLTYKKIKQGEMAEELEKLEKGNK